MKHLADRKAVASLATLALLVVAALASVAWLVWSGVDCPHRHCPKGGAPKAFRSECYCVTGEAE